MKASLGRALIATIAAGAAFFLVLRWAVRGVLPTWAVAPIAPLLLLALVAGVFHTGVALGPLATDQSGEPRPLWRRHGFWVIALGTCLALPMLGAFSLVDPWETHYAEVAREMLERHDFVSPWWAFQGWFKTKPVLTFWLEAAAMFTLGVRTGPDQVLANGAHPEWAVRMPAFAIALLGSYVLYHGVSRTCGRRAGWLGAVALWTMPGFSLLSHQAITDMPLIGFVAASLGLLLRALASDDAARAPLIPVRIGTRTLRLHAGHALAAWVVALTAPQLLGLLLEHVHVTASGWRLGPDALIAGSPHACGLPSQPPCEPVALAHPRFQPGLQALVFLPIVLWLVATIASERRTARLFALGAWTFAALAAMAKGPAGLAIPAASALVFALARRSWKSLLRLEIPVGIALAIAMIAPWYLALWARHGRAFLDELVIGNMIGRTLDHLHDTNEGEDVGLTYFVGQLGYATFPWSGLLAAAVLDSLSHDDRSRRSGARAVLAGAALFVFTLVSAMRTKFHHYVLPAVPPLAMLLGIWLDERIAESAKDGRRRLAATAVLAFGAACVVALVGRDFSTSVPLSSPGGGARLMHLFTYRYTRMWPSVTAWGPVFGAFGVFGAMGALALIVRRWRRCAVIALGAVAVAFTGFVLDVYLVRAAPDGGQRGVLEAYYRARGALSETALIAYQLNWKGENFYTGNDVAIFVSSGAPMHAWLEARQRAGERTFFFVTERGRVRALKAELGQVRAFDEVTDVSVSAEFSLVRAEM